MLDILILKEVIILINFALKISELNYLLLFSHQVGSGIEIIIYQLSCNEPIYNQVEFDTGIQDQVCHFFKRWLQCHTGIIIWQDESKFFPLPCLFQDHIIQGSMLQSQNRDVISSGTLSSWGKKNKQELLQSIQFVSNILINFLFNDIRV